MRRKFRREPADQRREALIASTLSLIARGGPEAATVRNIAEAAGVTQGLIRHYFSSKEELLGAAYERHMELLTDATGVVLEEDHASAVLRLAAFVTAGLTPPVVDAQAVALWAGFIHLVQRDPAMRAIHAHTYLEFRDQLEGLIGAALEEAGKPCDKGLLRRSAIACNAVIDGLWLEGGALPESFEAGELPEVGLASVGAILGLDLITSARRP
ncbi:TetR family transcriptional regulator [Hoeflea marina]|uniref:TetR family transcriptional regulator n=1 Tax=Hoeflea marina TaxID=274592 RepID=A0A317PPG1_9HYPH|nr:TetR family transcriptional regulator C-terminal domain-containing protein [Hoeflea marina]PWW01430.1 TetR family transcriptional regulator [Hoeflea marina]